MNFGELHKNQSFKKITEEKNILGKIAQKQRKFVKTT